jgi:hypothetical protein
MLAELKRRATTTETSVTVSLNPEPQRLMAKDVARRLGIAKSTLARMIHDGLPIEKRGLQKWIDLGQARAMLEQRRAQYPGRYQAIETRRQGKGYPHKAVSAAPVKVRQRLVTANGVARALRIHNTLVYKMANHEGMPSHLLSPHKRRFVIAECVAWYKQRGRKGAGGHYITPPRPTPQAVSQAARRALTAGSGLVTLNAEASAAVRDLCDRIGELLNMAIPPSDQASAMVLKAVKAWRESKP